MSRAVLTVVALIAAFFMGIASSGYAISHWPDLAGQRYGPWQRLSTIGQTDVDPYTRAYEHISSEIPTGNAEGQVYFASTDSDGQALSGLCNYAIEGEIPAARLFTLRAETTDGLLIKAPPFLQGALHSDQILFVGNSFKINTGAKAQPDNWLAIQTTDQFHLVLTYYDVAVINDDTGNSTRFPRIVKGSCLDV